MIIRVIEWSEYVSLDRSDHRKRLNAFLRMRTIFYPGCSSRDRARERGLTNETSGPGNPVGGTVEQQKTEREEERSNWSVNPAERGFSGERLFASLPTYAHARRRGASRDEAECRIGRVSPRKGRSARTIGARDESRTTPVPDESDSVRDGIPGIELAAFRKDSDPVRKRLAQRALSPSPITFSFLRGGNL
jgi:hypothetical protein